MIPFCVCNRSSFLNKHNIAITSKHNQKGNACKLISVQFTKLFTQISQQEKAIEP